MVETETEGDHARLFMTSTPAVCLLYFTPKVQKFGDFDGDFDCWSLPIKLLMNKFRWNGRGFGLDYSGGEIPSFN